MGKDWTPAELQAASAAMKAAGYMGYEEFCAAPELHTGDRFSARDKLGNEHTYTFRGIRLGAVAAARYIILWNEATQSETAVEWEWFGQRKIHKLPA